MIVKKISYRIKKQLGRINFRFENMGFTLGSLSIIAFLLLVILLMIINITDVYNRGQRNLELIESERQKLAELREEGEVLSEDLDFYKSSRFVESFARENFSLGKNEQILYKFDTEEDPVYELQVKNTDPILLDEHEYWWKRIFLW